MLKTINDNVRDNLTKSFQEFYPCRFCKSKFYTASKLYQHILDEHKQNLIPCDLCNVYFTDLSQLNLHIDKHATTNISIIKCSLCPKAFFSKLKLYQHEINHNRSDGGFILKNFDICTVEMPPHRNEYTGFENLFTCNVCIRSFKSDEMLKRHIVSHNSPKSISDNPETVLNLVPCKFCTKLFTPGSTHDRHLRTHLRSEDRKIYQCKFCVKRFVLPRQLFGHLKRFHKMEYPFYCTLCNLSFNNTCQFSSHIKSLHKNQGIIHMDHNYSIVYKYSTDNKIQKHFSQLNLNTFCKIKKTKPLKKSIDKTEKLLKCHICFRWFQTFTKLEWHKKTHLKPIKYLCICKVEFNSAVLLNEHKLICKMMQNLDILLVNTNEKSCLILETSSTDIDTVKNFIKPNVPIEKNSIAISNDCILLFPKCISVKKILPQ